MEEVKVSVTPKNGTLEIRTGAALPLKEPKVLNLSGVITTVGDFADKRKKTFPALEANVTANYTSRTITLSINENSAYSGSVTGRLELFPELKSLNINANQTYDEKELMKKLNFYGRWFTDKDEHKSLLLKLQNFKAKVNMVFTNADDFKGTAAIEKLTRIEHDIPLSFELNIPLFSGGDKKSFKVDVCVSIRDGGVSFWLESVELHELTSIGTDEIFEKELARLSDFVIVKQW